MKSSSSLFTRREFTKSTMITGAALASGALISMAADESKRIRVGLIGCGSVSGQYLPQLKKCPYAEVVSLCDRKYERAQRRGQEFKVANTYPNIGAMLAGVPFDFLVDTTDMQEHEGINRQGLEAGKHVWSEKPIANTLVAGQELLRLAKQKHLRLWGAPITVQSPQFAFMAKQLAVECLVTGKELLVTPEHALHVLEIITAARESSAAGKRIALTSTFKWPVVA